MKINPEIEEKDKTELIQQKQIEKQQVLIGSILPKRGHTLFECNLYENTVNAAKIENTANVVFIDGKPVVKKKVIKNKGCVYVSALNKKNAIKKVKKLFVSIK